MMLIRPQQLFVDGAWSRGSGGRLSVVDPATEEVVGEALDASADDVARAVAAARRSFDSGLWRRRPLEERIAVLRAVLQAVAGQREEFARAQTRQMGAPVAVARALVDGAARMLDAYVDGARAITFEYLRRDGVGQSLVRREPVGVVAIVIPWNGPLSSVVSKVAPALLLGCSVVLKPAPETPAEAGRFAELCTEAGLPDGVLNVVTGGAGTGAALVAAPGVDRVSFTGSTRAGQQVGEVCGRLLRPVSLELGGKSAALLLDDADLAVAVPEVVTGNFFNTGQICVATSRVLVPAGRQDEIVAALRQETARRAVGDPWEETTQIGPLVSARQRDRVERYVQVGRDAGARLVLGGRRPGHLPRGWYYEPTIFAGVDNSMTVAREEIFGPVLSVIPYRDEEHALQLVNDSAYGLHGAVFSADAGRALSVAGAFRTGSVAVNRCGLTPGTPYGGVKSSGLGREHGREGLEAHLEHHAYILPGELADGYAACGVPVA